MRAFVAIDLPPDAVAILARLQDRLPMGRPADPDTFHVTLTFLGEDVPEDELAEFNDLASALRLPGFDLELRGLSAWGGQSPAVLVADAVRSDALVELQARVSTAARRAGITLERRRFRPHVTLARFRHRLEPAAQDRLARFLQSEARFRLDPFAVRSFALYASTLTKAGPVHDELARYPLVA